MCENCYPTASKSTRKRPAKSKPDSKVGEIESARRSGQNFRFCPKFDFFHFQKNGFTVFRHFVSFSPFSGLIRAEIPPKTTITTLGDQPQNSFSWL